VILWAGLIFGLSSIPQLTTGWGLWDFIFKKSAHITEYFILTWLLYRAFKGSFNLSFLYLFLWPFILSFLYAVSDEIHQLFVPGRSGNPVDVVIDTLGIIGFFIFLKYKDKFKLT
jgi:VanZ family protein